MRSLLFLITVLACGLTLNFCNNTKHLTSRTEALFRNKWALMEVQGQQIPDSLRYGFEFSPGNLSGSTGCNRLSAGFVAGKNQTVRFTPDVPSKKDCANEGAAKLEAMYLDALTKSTKWELHGGELWLADDTGVVTIKFRSL